MGKKVSKVFIGTKDYYLYKLTKIQKSKGQLTLNIGKRGLQVQGADLEMIDLADEVPPPSYEKLYNPDCHNEKSVRLPKQKPKFSYASGQHPIFPLLNKGESNNDSFNFENQSQEDDFPSPSALLNVEGDAGYPFFNSMTDAAPVPTNLSGTVEATTPVFDNSIEPRTPEPGITSSFENGIFDFSAFSDHPCAQDIFSSPLMKSSLKRPPPPTPELPEAKCRRVEHKQTANREETASQSEVKALRQEDAQQRSTPAWVDEFDQAFIDDLKGIVEFMD
jgi:ATP-dependent DNA helicase HFM1/MER3